ncbi:YqaJ viral recombinase family protein [Xenorhabdus sp. 18]|uniref:lambda exonuclease family protein n=1 Tax=Xenorhabdus doucetiae TaxID=351671 RepID=UPI001999CD56|nr:YqaJ viral recombinase family protein [Xenorhabdus sp. 18]MBD2798372.1 YqaJ viral recombinase family protein [Xenorhabdus sp. 18]
MEQRTDEWYQARLGKVTASGVANIMAKTKNGYSASRHNYLAKLICEHFTGRYEEGFKSAAMERGIELEPVAREMYCLNEFDATVQETGFIDHPAIELFGASPDGLVNNDGLLEIKCPNTWTHLDTIKTGTPKREYLLQMHAQMMCTGRKWCDFISYDDRLPPNLSYFKTRILFNEELAKEIEKEVLFFVDELKDAIRNLTLLGETVNAQGE